MPGADEREVARVLGAGDDYQVLRLSHSSGDPCGDALTNLLAGTSPGNNQPSDPGVLQRVSGWQARALGTTGAGWNPETENTLPWAGAAAAAGRGARGAKAALPGDGRRAAPRQVQGAQPACASPCCSC